MSLSSSLQLFKDGIGASYMMGKAVATTAVFHGVNEKISEHYLPVYNRTRIDNLYSRFVYMTTNAYKNISFLTEAMVNVVTKEQQEKIGSLQD